MQPFLRLLQHKQLQRRVTLMMGVAVAFAVIMSSVGGYVALHATLVHASESLAMGIAGDLAGPASEDLRTTGGLTTQVRQAGTVVVEAVDTTGNVQLVPGDPVRLVLGETERAAAGPSGVASQRVGTSVEGLPYVIVAVPMPSTGYALVVGRPLTSINLVMAMQRWILLIVSAASILAAAVVGGFVARSSLRPVRQLSDAVQHAAQTRDFQPVAVRHATGEMATLACSFNEMLRTVAQMRERQARLIADAGHELRNPLTSLRANIDLLALDLSRNKLSYDERGELVCDVQAQLGELTGLVSDLMHLSRDEAEERPQQLDLREVVQSAIDRVQRRGQDRIFDVELQPLFMMGNPDALGRAVVNLLDNAVKWSPTGGTIRVRLQGNRLRVSDEGPGIPEADLPYVFDRFFRGHTGRGTNGTGLGLSIVAKTIEEHGGTVSAGRSAQGGAEFTLRLPGVTSREALPRELVSAG